jgi:pyruvate/2-oxoglutarate dehydrogenase complex dihydrolipoamide dehydrogenase (E3) component
MEEKFDCIVIGGGSAGYAAARTAHGHGLRVAVVDGAEELGGLCILRGCMPSKTLIESANRFYSMRRAEEFGLRAENLRVIPAEIRERKRRLIAEFASYRAGQLRDGRFPLFRGRARFLDAHRVAVETQHAGTVELEGSTFILATGSRISIPDVPGLREARPLTSDDVLDSDTLPRSIIVLGGGPIALELAWYHHALGCDTTIIQRSPRLVRSCDADLAITLEKTLRESGMIIHTDTKLLEVKRKEDETCLVLFEKGGETHTARADEVLCALGREPATDGLGLANAGFSNSARLATNDEQATSLPHIFAAGDACGPHEIVHIAIAQGETAATNAAVLLGRIAPEKRRKMDYRVKLFAMFSQPELATVGLGEDEAGEREILAATYPFDDHGKSMVMGETSGFVKLIADAKSGEILGGGVVGPHASELIHEISVAISARLTAAEFAQIPHYHPTLSEIWTYPAEEISGRILERSET